MREYRIIVAGSRTIQDYNAVLRTVGNVISILAKEEQSSIKNMKDRIEIISGGAKGVDQLGEEFARKNDIKVKIFEADWDRYGKRAGPIRNSRMADYAKEKIGILILIWDGKSKGSRSMRDIAKMANLRIFETIIEDV